MRKSVRLISLNISIFDENNEKLARFLKETKPDIICFQEVTRKVDDSARDSYISKGAIDQATPQLAYSFYAPNWALRDFHQRNFHGKNFFQHDFGGVIEYGNYVRSKYTIVGGKSVFLQHHFSYMTDWEYMEKNPGTEPRMVQVVDIKLDDGQKVRVINYHGIWSKDKQGTERTKTACEKLNQLAAEVTYPAIICGDFNLFPHSKSIETLKKSFTSLVDEFNITHTRPKSNELSSAKRNVVDYIFLDRKIEVKKLEVIDSDVSDHLPLLLEFSI